MGLSGRGEDEAKVDPRVRSSQHLRLMIDLSWSGPGRGEVIVVEGLKKRKKIQACAQLGPVCALSFLCLSPALPCW